MLLGAVAAQPRAPVITVGAASGIGAAFGVYASFEGIGAASGFGDAFAFSGSAGLASGVGDAAAVSIAFLAETDAWAAAVVSAGGTVSGARKILVNSLISGLQTDSLWTKIDRIWLFAAENTQSALIDLKANATATAVSSPTFTTDRGYAGNGSSSYVNLAFNPSTASTPNYVRNDAHWGHWSRTASAGTNIRHSGTSFAFNTFCDNGGVKFMRINDNGGSISLPSSNVTDGFFVASRSGASTTSMYKNGTSFVTPNAASVAVDNQNFYVGWVGDADGNKSTIQTAAFTIGSNMQGGSDAANLYSRLQTYMTAVGA